MNIILIMQLLLLLMVANGSPVLARRLLGRRLGRQIDFGHVLSDRRPLFGASKTWRGLVLAVLLTAVTADLLGFGFRYGAAFGALAMCGDLLSSFVKRRLGYQPSSRAVVLDQLPESLLPLLGLAGPWQLQTVELLVVAGLFFILSIVLSKLLFVIGVRRQPY